VELQSKGKLIIGQNCGINSFSRIIAFERIRLGNNVSIAQFVSILDHDHSTEYEEGKIDFTKFTTKPIEIGSNVWIGDKVSINKGVKIGDNVVIGANSVVTHDIPSNSIAAGIPARVIKEIRRK
jgi:acetyltransferase-like isoleucine patch superfamily enzyme